MSSCIHSIDLLEGHNLDVFKEDFAKLAESIKNFKGDNLNVYIFGVELSIDFKNKELDIIV
jgi:hypothetical protein